MLRQVILAALLGGIAWGQTFEVASVKVNTTGERPSGDFKGDRLIMSNMPMMVLVAQAYGVANDKVAGPVWFNGEGYDIVAKLPPETTEAAYPAMLRNLLIERFKLEAHREQKIVPVYALLVAKGGPKLRAAAADSQTSNRCGVQGMVMTCKNQKTAMAELVRHFPRWMSMNWFDLPIVDQTGLTGTYDFDLSWTMARTIDQSVEPPAVSFFDALQEQLGLKLEQRKAAVERIVVDRIERVPVSN
jgi:uncharacterized protein (TIGR03435 family)